MDLVIQYDAIITAVIAATVIGWLWYSPMLFGKQWRKLVGRTDKQVQKSIAASFTTWFVASIVMAFILDNILIWMGATTMFAGILVAFWIWLGFVLTTITVNSVFAGRPKALLWLEAGYQLLAMLVMGAILAVWV